jgi:hypothetical protein
MASKIDTKTISTTTTITTNLVVLPPVIQKRVNALREGRNLAKQGKEISELAREQILDFLKNPTTEIVGTDAKGKRLISIKMVDSPERMDWKLLEKENPELYKLVIAYKIPKGAGDPTPRIDIL